jgi:hypothetical protein
MRVRGAQLYVTPAPLQPRLPPSPLLSTLPPVHWLDVQDKQRGMILTVQSCWSFFCAPTLSSGKRYGGIVQWRATNAKTRLSTPIYPPPPSLPQQQQQQQKQQQQQQQQQQQLKTKCATPLSANTAHLESATTQVPESATRCKLQRMHAMPDFQNASMEIRPRLLGLLQRRMRVP